MTEENKKKRFLEAFDDPTIMLILLKILRKPNISSKKLKNELNIKGTKIYYYLGMLEGKETLEVSKLDDNAKMKLYKDIPVIKAKEQASTRSHLKEKTYQVEKWFIDYLDNSDRQLFLNIFQDVEQAKLWAKSLKLKLTIGLMEQQLDEIKNIQADYSKGKISREEMERINQEDYGLILVKSAKAKEYQPKMKSFFEEICEGEDLEDPLSEQFRQNNFALIVGALDLHNKD
jgi:hypothetical protein